MLRLNSVSMLADLAAPAAWDKANILKHGIGSMSEHLGNPTPGSAGVIVASFDVLGCKHPQGDVVVFAVRPAIGPDQIWLWSLEAANVFSEEIDNKLSDGDYPRLEPAALRVDNPLQGFEGNRPILLGATAQTVARSQQMDGRGRMTWRADHLEVAVKSALGLEVVWLFDESLFGNLVQRLNEELDRLMM